MSLFARRFLGALVFLAILTVLGTTGYLLVEGVAWRDARIRGLKRKASMVWL